MQIELDAYLDLTKRETNAKQRQQQQQANGGFYKPQPGAANSNSRTPGGAKSGGMPWFDPAFDQDDDWMGSSKKVSC